MTSGTTVVVGAAHGIGAAIARRVARETWTSKLIIAGISDEPMHALASELSRDDLPVEVVHVDLADQSSIAALVAATGEAERVAIAAGIYTSAPAMETTREQIDSVMAINLFGFFYSPRLFP